MHRFALGIIAAVALSALDAGAQVGLVDVAPRLSTMDLGRWTTTASGQAGAADTTSAGVTAPVPPVPRATHRAARAAGAPRSEPTLARRASRSADESPLVPQTAKERRGMKYMLVGAGVLLTGAIVDDDAGDILMIGGLVIGLYGLWIFLN